MSTIKVFDPVSKQWTVAGSSSANDIEVTNPGFVDEVGGSVSVDLAFTKLDNRLYLTEQNVAWLYNNGGVGGGPGGGGGGGGETNYTMEIIGGNTIYTATTQATVNILIKSGGSKKLFTVVAKDLKTNKVLGTWKKYSMSQTDLVFNDLSGTTNIELSAYDSFDNYVEPQLISIIAGAIKLELDKIPPKTIYINGINPVPANFVLTNNIKGAVSDFTIKINGKLYDSKLNINTPTYNILYDTRKILILEFNAKPGQRFEFEAVAGTTLNGEAINSNIIKFDITVASAETLTIVLDDITEFIPSETVGETINDLTTYVEGGQATFRYFLSCGVSKYQLFNLDYTFTLVKPDGSSEIIESSTRENIDKGSTKLFVFSTVKFPVCKEGEYFRLDLNGYATSDPLDTTVHDTALATFRIIEAVEKDLYANNDALQLLAYYSPLSGFPQNPKGTWAYKPSASFPYEGVFSPLFPDGVKLSAKRVNGTTTGFILDIDGINGISGIVLTGESYAEVEVGSQLFPDIDGDESGIFQQLGFNISFTYISESDLADKNVILSLGQYEKNELINGLEVTNESVHLRVGSVEERILKLPTQLKLTIDLDVSQVAKYGWYFKLYINGVMSAVIQAPVNTFKWNFNSNIFLGCRNDKGILSRFSDVTFFDFKIYTRTLTDVAIILNYISALEQASLKLGAVDKDLDAALRLKNFFTVEGKCLLWDYNPYADAPYGKYYQGDLLLNNILKGSTDTLACPIVYVEETSIESTFLIYNRVVFPEAEKDSVMKMLYPCKVTFHSDVNKSVVIQRPEGVTNEDGVRIGFQGTSSLSYTAKNYELYLGHKDETGKNLLFTPNDDEWLPENRFTLKADVMDSAHVNNVAIGKIINGAVKDLSGQPFKPFENTPPMLIPNSYWGADESVGINMKRKMKHTSDGFQCLVFIKYAGQVDSVFCGIYNFNLGRAAVYNLGLRLLKSYEKVSPSGPTLVTEYEEDPAYYNSGASNGTHSIEIRHNHSEQGAFQQDDDKIIRYMGYPEYTSRDTTLAYNNVKLLYTLLASMPLQETPRYTVTDDGSALNKPLDLPPYRYDPALYTGELLNKVLHWGNARAYYMIMFLFGMVDSVCKNLTLRSWGGQWFTSFYDMDSAFAVNNTGQDNVSEYCHLHRYFNVYSKDGITRTGQKMFYSTSEEDGFLDYGSYWSRLWEVVENLPLKDKDVTTTIYDTYLSFRTNFIKDPDSFIKEHYEGYANRVGSIIYNYDYNVKYLQIELRYNPDTGNLEDTTNFSQLRFLHGNRVIHVKDWFKKRLYFLDSIYGIRDGSIDEVTGLKQGDELILPTATLSPIVQNWGDGRANGKEGETVFVSKMSGQSKVRMLYATNNVSYAVWIDENPEELTMRMPSGNATYIYYANKYITQHSNFKAPIWTALPNVNMPLLKTMDLSGYFSVDSTSFFTGGVYDKANDIGLKNVETLNLSGFKFKNNAIGSLNVENCVRLKTLNISSSQITSVILPKNPVLETYDLSNTDITTLVLKDLAFLKHVNISGCNKLTSVLIINCSSLSNLEIPPSVTEVMFTNCEFLDSISIPYNSSQTISPLKSIIIEGCPGLKSFNILGQNNQELVVSLIGAPNLESLNISNTMSLNIILPSVVNNNFTSLKSLNISRTNLQYLSYNESEPIDYLDLTYFPNLSDINALECSQLLKVACCNNPDNPIELNSFAFADCKYLQRIYGNFELGGSDIFRGCSSFIINTPDVYSSQGFNTFYTGTDVTNISIHPQLSSFVGQFEGCSSISYDDFKYVMLHLNKLLVSLERSFKGCINISGEIWRDIFVNCSKVVTIKEMLSGTGISGILFSNKSNFSINDKSTYGILLYLSSVVELDSAFSNTALSYIDNNLFYNTYSSKYANIDKLLLNCGSLSVVQDTNANPLVKGALNSETFFLNLDGLIDTYPKEVFSGCLTIDMDIINRDNTSLLYHKKKAVTKPTVLDNSLYSGVNLIGEIKSNVFGGTSNTFENYFFPNFTSIKSPFSNTGNSALIDLSLMSTMFSTLAPTILLIISPFSGLSLISTKMIPDDILKGCVKLTSASGLLAGLELDNKGKIYNFPPPTLFEDCISLTDISNILRGVNTLQIRLQPKGFKNCKLINTSNAFASSWLIETIPYLLWYMERNGKIQQTIKDMSGAFSNCFCLGYDRNRKLDVGSYLNSVVPRPLTWDDNIVFLPGEPYPYKLDMSNILKLPTVADPSVLAFDDWYLDGYGYEGAVSSDPDFPAFKQSLMDKYLKYDIQQAKVILELNLLGRYIDTYLNYKIPTDLFRYCDPTISFTEILNSLNWFRNEIVIDEATGIQEIKQTTEVDGMMGRIPMRLLEGLPDLKSAANLFFSTYFTPFVGLLGSTVNDVIPKRGMMYPPDLFTFNSKLEDTSNTFSFTSLTIGVDINSDLFVNNPGLKNISNMWANCAFNPNGYTAETLPENLKQFPLINFEEIFKVNTKISNASGLFSVSKTDGIYGLYFINNKLLGTCNDSLNNIASMFFNNTSMKGEVPLFRLAQYPVLNSVVGYLTGVPKDNITNADQLEERLIPTEWVLNS